MEDLAAALEQVRHAILEAGIGTATRTRSKISKSPEVQRRKDTPTRDDLKSALIEFRKTLAEAEAAKATSEPESEPERYGEPELYDQPERYGAPERFGEPELYDEPERYVAPELYEEPERYGAPERFGAPEPSRVAAYDKPESVSLPESNPAIPVPGASAGILVPPASEAMPASLSTAITSELAAITADLPQTPEKSAAPSAQISANETNIRTRSVLQQPQDEDVSDIARRVSQITVSAIKQMPMLAAKIRGCVSLGQGIPSFNTPDFIRDAVIHQLQTNPSIGKYTLQPGLPALRQAVAEDLKRTRGLPRVDPEREVFISCGGMEALAATLATIVERGDEVILPSPTYSSHIEQVLFAEGEPRFVPLLQPGWELDVDGIRAAITGKTKAIVLCNPVNPTGTVFSPVQLRAVADLVVEHDLFLVMDEAYDFLLYDGMPFFSPVSVPELKEHVIVVCSFSKRFFMTGWRVGFMYACERIIRQVLKVHDAFAICAPTISQYAALAALKETNGHDGMGDRLVQDLVVALDQRRNLVCRRLDALPDLFQYVKPGGGYYVFPQISVAQPSIEFALRLLNEAKVVTIPGSAFGPHGEGHIRLSFGAKEEELNEAFDRIDRFWHEQ